MSKIISVKVEDKIVEQIDVLIEMGLYGNRSEVLRDIIKKGLEKVYEEIEYREKIEKIVKILLEKCPRGIRTKKQIDVTKLIDEERNRWIM